MLPIEKRILSKMLDSYERSSLLRGNNKVAVHIFFDFNKKQIPEYFDESSVMYEDIHALLRQLEKKGFLKIEWRDGKVDHIVKRLVLCEDALPKIYRHLNRMPKTEMETLALQQIEELSGPGLSTLTSAFLLRIQTRLQEGKSVKEYLDLEDLLSFRRLIQALDLTEKNTEECFVREFSIQHFKDSKCYENLIPKVCRILREENAEYEHLENDEILAEYQIFHTPSYVYLKGDVQLLFQGKQLNLCKITNGLGLAIDKKSALELQVSSDCGIKSVYTIENLTSFFRFQRENSLVIYLGGYHNHARRELLKKIYAAFPNAVYYHFGDIDAGGFYIYHHLKEKTGIPFQLFQMNRSILKKYEQYARELKGNDRKRLKQLLTMQISDEERECIRYMLEHNVKLEQECL